MKPLPTRKMMTTFVVLTNRNSMEYEFILRESYVFGLVRFALTMANDSRELLITVSVGKHLAYHTMAPIFVVVYYYTYLFTLAARIHILYLL